MRRAPLARIQVAQVDQELPRLVILLGALQFEQSLDLPPHRFLARSQAIEARLAEGVQRAAERIEQLARSLNAPGQG